MWTFICICILHYYHLWNHVKISFWTCYYTFFRTNSVLFIKYRNRIYRYQIPFVPSFLRNRPVPVSQEPNLHRYWRTEPIGSVFTECPGWPAPTSMTTAPIKAAATDPSPPPVTAASTCVEDRLHRGRSSNGPCLQLRRRRTPRRGRLLLLDDPLAGGQWRSVGVLYRRQ
jgi:hypothetical protein